MSNTLERQRLFSEQVGFEAAVGTFEERVAAALIELKKNQIIKRIWSHDHTVWKSEPTEITNRLGWLDSPKVMMRNIVDIEAFVKEVQYAGYTTALLLGMGGSSLAPEVFRFTFGVRDGYLDLAVLDGTDPGVVLQFSEKLDPAKTLFIVSTKSGGTVETLSLFKYFYNWVADSVGKNQVGRHFTAITDAGSSLEKIAKELNFRTTFLNDPNIGGRFSALSFFGLVPAALIGMDVRLFLERAVKMAENCSSSNSVIDADNSGALFGTIMGELALAGRDKLTLIASPQIKHFGLWAEQLIAESTGKEGKGILPVDGEQVGSPEDYAPDRLFVYMRLAGDSTYDDKVQALRDARFPVVQLDLNDLYDLGGELFRWEFATVVASHFLKINPFDQPNVESAKVLARQMVSEYYDRGQLPELKPAFITNDIDIYTDIHVSDLNEALSIFFAFANTSSGQSAPRSYVAIQAYVQPTPETEQALKSLQLKIRDVFKLATTVGYGPRFLHSTGQLHKGDAGNGLFIQLTADSPQDAKIPDNPGDAKSSMTFGVLKMAQALGDRKALLDAGRKVIRFHFRKNVIEGIRHIEQAIS
ncbi:MAG: glucose-6-phosphate isomerase [bacterium]